MTSNDQRESNLRTKAVVEKVQQLALPRLEKALPKSLGLEPRRFLHTAIQAFYKTPQLADCDITSVIVSIITAAQVGIECDGIHGALVPYKGKCQFIPMYQGLMASVQRSGLVAVVRPPRVVYEGDFFEYEYGLEEKMRHVPGDDPENQTWEKLTHVYCVAVMKDGSKAFVVLPRKAIMSIRGRSAARSQSPWNSDPIPMAQKTAVRHLCKYLPKSAEDKMLANLLHVDDLAEAGIEEGSEIESEVRAEAGPKSRAAKVMAAAGSSKPIDDEPLELSAPPPDYVPDWDEAAAPRVDDDTGLPAAPAPEPVPVKRAEPEPKAAPAARAQPAPAQAAPQAAKLPPIPPAPAPQKKPAEAPVPRQASLTDNTNPKSYD